MIRAFRSELVKVLRRRVLLLTGLAVAIVAVGGTALVLSSAEPAGPSTSGQAVTIEELSEAGGGTALFMRAASFAGFFVFVLFLGAIAVEFGRGTFRTMTVRQPRRVRLMAGKMLGLLTYAGAVLLVTLPLTWITARLLAPSQDVATDAWASLDAIGAGIVDFGSVLYWVAGYAIFGMTLAVLTRSVPIALGVGIAWAGPFEHLVADAWNPAYEIFPGLQLEAFVAGGTDNVSAGQAFVTIAGYIVVAVAVASISLARRDVTA